MRKIPPPNEPATTAGETAGQTVKVFDWTVHTTDDAGPYVIVGKGYPPPPPPTMMLVSRKRKPVHRRRPRGTGMFKSADDFLAFMVPIVTKLEATGEPLTEEHVAAVVDLYLRDRRKRAARGKDPLSARQLRRWVKDLPGARWANWDAFIAEARTA